MLGMELTPNLAKLPGRCKVEGSIAPLREPVLHAAGLLTIPAGTQVIRLLPALNLRNRPRREEGLKIIESAIAEIGWLMIFSPVGQPVRAPFAHEKPAEN